MSSQADLKMEDLDGHELPWKDRSLRTWCFSTPTDEAWPFDASDKEKLRLDDMYLVRLIDSLSNPSPGWELHDEGQSLASKTHKTLAKLTATLQTFHDSRDKSQADLDRSVCDELDSVIERWAETDSSWQNRKTTPIWREISKHFRERLSSGGDNAVNVQELLLPLTEFVATVGRVLEDEAKQPERDRAANDEKHRYDDLLLDVLTRNLPSDSTKFKDDADSERRTLADHTQATLIGLTRTMLSFHRYHPWARALEVPDCDKLDSVITQWGQGEYPYIDEQKTEALRAISSHFRERLSTGKDNMMEVMEKVVPLMSPESPEMSNRAS